MDIMDVSKGLHACIKRIDVFHMLIDKPTRTLVPARCNPIVHGIFKVRYGEG